MPPVILDYLNNLYASWRNNPQLLFSDPNMNIPIDQLGQNGYSTQCPPVPWLGNINRQIKMISLEPMLRQFNFFTQIQITSQGQNEWINYYLTENYFNNLFGGNPNQGGYWIRVAFFIKGFLRLPFNNGWIQTLADSIVEFPFVQYHSDGHPAGFVPTNTVLNDLIQRLNFGNRFQTPPEENMLNQIPITPIVFIYGLGNWINLKPLLNVLPGSNQVGNATIYQSSTYGPIVLVPQNSPNLNLGYDALHNLGLQVRDNLYP